MNSTRATGKHWTGRFHGYGHFDTLRCAMRFANGVIDSGLVPLGRKP